jgi:uncharacterized repeat protein (TIGR03803 family)
MRNKVTFARALTIGILVGSAATWTPSASAQLLTTLYNFCSQGGASCTDGGNPEAPLLQATDGSFYGTTNIGGSSGPSCPNPGGCGSVFRLTPSGALTTLYSFCAEGTTGCSGGMYPQQPLIQANDGDLYGTTTWGGSGGHNCNNTVAGCGAAFKITLDGTLTPLHSFCSASGCPDGAYPWGALVQGADGNFYGTTNRGGANWRDLGTVFEMTPAGTVTTLYSFGARGGFADGSTPVAGLVQAEDGNLYGTTGEGGSGAHCPVLGGCGTIFRITPNGTLTTLYNFCSQSGCTDGAIPQGALMQGVDGSLYGATLFGGSGEYCPADPNPGGWSTCGTIFRITPGGAFATLYNFCSQSGCADGSFPGGNPSGGPLVEGADGTIYGTTSRGGNGAYCFSPGACGTAFSLTPSGTLITLHEFCSDAGCADGYGPGALIQAKDGELYGTTTWGGTGANCNGGYGCGTVFRLTLEEEVSIDIKPGDPSNIINLKSGGVVPTAILGSATFDPMTVEPSKVTLAGAPVATRGNGQPMSSAADVNHDGYPDLILFFRVQDMTALAAPSAGHGSVLEEAVLYGKTYGGTPIRGSDQVQVISPPGRVGQALLGSPTSIFRRTIGIQR